MDELAVAELSNDEQQVKLQELIASCGKAQVETQITQSQMKSMETLISSQAERIQNLEVHKLHNPRFFHFFSNYVLLVSS